MNPPTMEEITFMMKGRKAESHGKRKGTGRKALAAFLAAGALAFMTPVLSAQEIAGDQVDAMDPSEIYFRSYVVAGESEKAEKEGDFNKAAEKIAEAVMLVERIRRDHPEWKPEMVARRTEANAATVERIRPKAESILAGVNQPVEPLPEEEEEIIPQPPRKKAAVRPPLRKQMPPNWESPQITNEYFDKRSLFDSLLKMKTRPDQVQLLCSQFGRALGRMEEACGETSPQLRKSITHEKERLPQVSSGYLSAPIRFARVRLSKDWMDASSHDKAVQDFRRLFGQHLPELAGERPDFLPAFGEGTTFFQKPYLCQLGEFIKPFRSLKGFRSKSSRISIGVPGFPKGSFYYHPFDGDFNAWGGPGGDFNRMVVVTDSWDQVAAVQFTSESPKAFIDGVDVGMGMYNYVQFRRKGTPSYKVIHQTEAGADGTFRITTMLRSSDKPKEINVLYLPKPTVMLLQYCLAPKMNY